MIDKVQKIRKEVEIVVNRRLNLLNGDYFDLNEETDGLTNEIMDIIDSLQEEPVSDDLGDYINELSKQFPEVSFAKLSRIAVRVAKWQKARNQETIETAIHHAYHNGRLEMKEQMMSKAIDAIPCSILGKEIIYTDLPKGIEVGDEVKVIIIKEE